MRSPAEARPRAAASALVRSRHSRRPWRSALGAALALLLAARVAPAQEPPQKTEADPIAADAPRPTQAQVDDALATVKADPNLAFGRTVRTLQWRSEPSDSSGWLAGLFVVVKWIVGFLAWIATAGRALVWVAAAVLAALLVVYLARVVRARGMPQLPKKFVAPSHVRDLDIRPESLPEDVGAAAMALWDRGAHRAALALLYRGLLSRLVHVHAVPIRDSSTEGECLALAAPRVGAERTDYAARLVRVWQGAVYGTERPAGAAVHALCADFGRVLDAEQVPPAAAGGAAAG